MHVHRAVAEMLVREGVDTVFGLIGDGNLFFADSFATIAGTRYVAAAHEAGAILMASGFAATTQGPSVATVTHGPGLTNTITALTEAVRTRRPLLLITGAIAASDRSNPQLIDHRALVAATGAHYQQTRFPQTCVDDVRRALRTAWMQSIPVVVDVPVNFWWHEVDGGAGSPAASALGPRPTAGAGTADALDAALGILATANRPIVLAGRGVATESGRAALTELAERAGAAVATTVRAKDLFAGDPFDLGVFGSLSTDAASEFIAASDCVVVFGAGLHAKTTDDGGLLAGKRIVRVDSDPTIAASDIVADVVIVGDGAEVARQMARVLAESGFTPGGFRSDRMRQSLAAPSRPVDGGPDTAVDIEAAMVWLDRTIPRDRVVVFDAGRFGYSAFRHVHAPRADHFVDTLGFASIGFGVATGIGAGIGCPDRPVLVVCGDGGFMMGGITEFAAAVREGIDLIVAVVNDSAYGAEHIQLTQRGLDPGISVFPWPDLATVARALGGSAVTVRNRADLANAEEFLLSRRKPVLIDFIVDPDTVRV